VSFDLVDLGCCAKGGVVVREHLPQGAVRPVTVVVAFELVQHDSGVSLVDDQEAVEEFAADCPDEALRDWPGRIG
jgi:hypothetical protein